MNRLLILSALMACNGGDSKKAPADTGSTESTDPTPYIDEETPAEAPGFDSEVVATVVEDAIIASRALHAGPIIEGYAEVMAGADADCPTVGMDQDVPYWFDSCTSAAGVTFDGYAYFLPYDGYFDGSITWDGYALYGIATITSAEGHQYEAGGGAGLMWGPQADGGQVFYTYMEEGFAYDGPAAEGTWLSGGVSPELTSYGLAYANGARALVLTGRVEVDEGSVQAVVFDDLFLANEAMGSPCPTEPSGTISVLGADGWYDLVFEGPLWEEFEGADTAACDGCGTAWYKGQRLGEACVDFSSMTGWTTHPWE